MRINWQKWLIVCILLLSCVQIPVLAQTSISLDSTTLSELTSATPQQTFTVFVEANQTVSIQLTEITQNMGLQGVVLNANNAFILAIGNPNDDATILADFTPSETDTYSIQINSTSNATGEFVLRLSSISEAELCETLVYDTLEDVQQVCQGVGRNQACLGNLSASAVPAANISPNTTVSFEAIGDIVNLFDVESFQLSPFNTSNNDWGVALLSVQADIPDSLPGQNVTMLLFGDVSVTNLTSTNPDVLTDYRPMQAFYFTGGIGQERCNAVPDTGILIQTPEIDAQVSFLINGVVVDLGSTAFLSLSDQQTLDIDLLEGAARISSQNQSRLMIGGQRISIPVDANSNAAAPPNAPIPIPEDAPRFRPDVIESDTRPETATPVGTTTAPNPQLTPVDGERPQLPTTGQCVLRVFDENNNPNVRSSPLQNAPIVSFIIPSELYPVIGRNAESSWYQISTGWVAGFVTERGGDCSTVPVTYIPPTATPLPTVTPSLPIAGNNSFSITIDAEVFGTQHTLSGHISSPQGVARDNVSYTVINAGMRGAGSELAYSITCTGVGVEHAIIIFSDGFTTPCSAIPSNYLDMGFNSLSDTISIGFDSSVGDAYVTWTMSFSVR